MTTEKKGRGGALSVEALERAAAVLRLLAHPHRLKIVEYLETREAPVFEITERVVLPQAVVSQHLNQMKRVGLVRSVRRGREVWYALGDPRCLRILNCIRHQEGES